MRAQRRLLIGANSMLGAALLAEAHEDAPTTAISHQEIATTNFGDYTLVVNMAYDPLYKSRPYDEALDVDRAIAARLRLTEAHFVMMSTRRVYGPGHQGPISEEAPARPKDHYGLNKLQTERSIRDLLGDRCTILRLSNVFGFELGRQSFFGTALGTLSREGQITLDANPFTLKDFLPVRDFVHLLRLVLRKAPTGIYNLGSGIPTEIGRAAMWLIEGYGKGTLHVTSAEERDGFMLDISKITAAIGASRPAKTIRECCIELGNRLRHA